MEHREFIFSRVSWHEVTEKIATDSFEEVLNTYVKLEKYGSGIQAIYFTYIALKPSNSMHPNEATFDPLDKTVKIALGLDYQSVEKADQQKVKEMMAHLFLSSLSLYPSWNISGFDLIAFKQDIENLFTSRGWLSPAHQID